MVVHYRGIIRGMLFMDKKISGGDETPASFQSREIRRVLVDGEWFFSVVDVVGALTDSANPRDYWFKMKQRVQLEDGLELSTICRQLNPFFQSVEAHWRPPSVFHG